MALTSVLVLMKVCFSPVKLSWITTMYLFFIVLMIAELLFLAKLKLCHDLIVPAWTSLFEDHQGGFAFLHEVEVLLGSVVQHELFAELRHCEWSCMFEPCNELTTRTKEQAMPILHECFFGELIHCAYYAGTIKHGQQHLLLSGSSNPMNSKDTPHH